MSFDDMMARIFIDAERRELKKRKAPKRRRRSRMPKHPGEYRRVMHWSTDKGALAYAHETPTTEVEAYNLIQKWAELDGFGEIAVVFGKSKRGRGGPRKMRISLPDKVMPSRRRECWGYLRMGIVIHEYAHIYGPLKLKARGHDKRFVEALDFLIRRWNIERKEMKQK